MKKESQIDFKKFIPNCQKLSKKSYKKSRVEDDFLYFKSKYMCSFSHALDMKKGRRDRILKLLTYDSIIISYIKKVSKNNLFKDLVEKHIQLEFNNYTISKKLINIINQIPKNDNKNLLTCYIKNISFPGSSHKLLSTKDMPILYDFLIKLLESNIKH